MPRKTKTRRKNTAAPLARVDSGLPLVAILGRPNVGKSSLFNRLTGARRSIVTDEPGITRDRIYGTVSWMGRTFEVVDTGGMVPDEKGALPAEIIRQARTAIEAAAKLVLVTDARAGVTPLDEELARLLVRTGKPILLAANKVDSKGVETETLPFHKLGLEPVIPLSAEHGHGVAELLMELVADFPVESSGATPAAGADDAVEVEVAVNVAIIGRPNVGKSTLLNRLAGADRAIVSPEAGTTRDAVDTLLEVETNSQKKLWRLVDTAGIRRKGKTKLRAEKLSVVMARRHLERADVAVLLLDATEGVTALDATIAGYAHESGRGLVLAVNKWDALKKNTHTMNEWTVALRRKFKFLDYAQVVFISALEGQRLDRLRAAIAAAAENHGRRLADGELKLFLKGLNLARTTVPGGKDVKITGLKQASASPPFFIVHANIGRLHFSFKRFLANRLREKFSLEGTPLEFKLIPVGRGHRQSRHNQ